MGDHLSIEILRDLPHKQNGQSNDLLSIKRRERAKYFIRAIQLVPKFKQVTVMQDSPWTLKDLIPHPNQLRNNTQNVQMGPVRK
jgi:phenolic acid decarboxylase